MASRSSCFGCGGQGGDGGGDDLEAHVASGDCPLVVLLGEHGTDHADEGRSVREDADHVGAPTNLFVEPLKRVVGPDLPPDRLREGGEGEQLLAGVGQQLGKYRGSVLRGGRGPAGTEPGYWRASGCAKIERTRVATACCAALGTLANRFTLKCVRQRCQLLPGNAQPRWLPSAPRGVRGHQLHADQPPAHQRAQERQPPGSVLRDDHIHTQHLARWPSPLTPMAMTAVTLTTRLTCSPKTEPVRV